ncbi:MAG TPA: glycoside hydrolase family 2 TIM barrel-domain containing protein, partial [Bacteroidota bacterium]|nr:glycoside hydrolase family 2 TIM barrel-domain containing protein [Bacteroidota bacterium]
SLDETQWPNVQVPASIDYEGRIVFRKKFTIDSALIQSSAFKFVALGINDECEVYINEQFVGKHAGGSSNVELDVPQEILDPDGENIISIVVNNTLNGRTTLPVRQQVWGWKNYNGLLRDVFIVATPRLWIDKLHAQTSLNGNFSQGALSIDAVISARTFAGFHHDSLARSTKPKNVSYLLAAELYERFSDALVSQIASASLPVEQNKDTKAHVQLQVNAPKLWSPDSPEMYLLKTSIIAIDGKQRTLVDQYNINVGFTSVRVEKQGFFLNGNAIVLKGVVWNEDSPKQGASLTYEQMEKDVVLMKSLGANAVRFAFHPPHPYMLNLCSRYGLCVLEETPVWNVPGEILGDETFQTNAEVQVHEMVERDANYPCVLAWGIGDLFDVADGRSVDFVKRMTTAIKPLDTRPVYYNTGMLTNDKCKTLVDFVGFIPPSTDLKNFRSVLANWKNEHADQPALVLAYGKEVIQNDHNGYSDPLSQESQARFFMQSYAAIKDANYAGSFVLAFADWRGTHPLMSVDAADHYMYPIGLVSAWREKRLAYDIVHALYTDERIGAIPAGNFRGSFPVVHVLTGLLVIILIGYQAAYNRRFGESLRRALLRSYNFYSDLRNLHTVSILHTLMLATTISITLAGVFSSLMYHYRTDKFFDYMVTMVLISNPWKQQFLHAAWHPLWGILLLSASFFIAAWVMAFVLRFFALFVKTKVSLIHVYSVSVWAAAPLVFLSPVAMAVSKIMENSSYVLPSLLVVFLFLVWTFFRILKGISVVFEANPVKVHLGGVIIAMSFVGGVYYYADSAHALGAYIEFLFHLAQNVG